MKIVLSLLVLLALSPDAYAQFRGLSTGDDHVRFRAAAPPPIASVPATDADLARAERDSADKDQLLDELANRFGVSDDGLDLFRKGNAAGQANFSASFDGHEAVLHVRW